MQLKSLLEVIRKQFLHFFLIPVILMISVFFASSIFYKFNQKKSEDIAYVDTIKIPLVNSMTTFQTQETQILLNSISEHRKWSSAFLISEDGIVLSVFPSKEEFNLGAKYTDKCRNPIILNNAGMFVGKICYRRNFLDMIDSSLILSFVGLFSFILFIIFFYLNLLKKLGFFFRKLTDAVDGLKSSSTLQVQAEFLEEKIIMDAVLEQLKLSEEIKLKEIENIEFNARVQIATQMSHDIRSPIATIKHLSEKLKDFSSGDVKLLNSALLRIDEIANSHLGKTRGVPPQSASLNDLSLLITELVNEKRVELPNINFDLSLDPLCVNCVPGDLKRILSNLINNGYEARKDSLSQISIMAMKRDQRAIVQIKDNGQGIQKEILGQMGTTQVTTKSNGNGLGFKHAMQILAGWQAELKIVSTGQEGTVIEINFPIMENVYILIDDDELTRATWEMKAKQKKVFFRSFKCFEDFNLEKATVSKDVFIYIDSDLGGGVKGEDIALELHLEGFRNISMATGYSPDKFIKLTFLKSVISKKSPF